MLTLAAVAREAGIAAPSIYRHFPDRDELVEAVVADRFDRLDAESGCQQRLGQPGLGQ